MQKYTTSSFPSYKYSLEGETAAVSSIQLPIYYSLPVPLRVGGWVGLVGWPIADALPTKWSHVNHRSGAYQGKSASQRPTLLPLSHAAKYTYICIMHKLRHRPIVQWSNPLTSATGNIALIFLCLICAAEAYRCYFHVDITNILATFI